MKAFRSFNSIFAIIFALSFCSLTHADHHLTPVNLTGVWKAKASSDDGTRNLVWTFKKKDDKLTGVSVDQGTGDERELDRITIKEKAIVLEVDMEANGNKGVIRIEAEEKSAGKLVGKWSIIGEDGNVYMDGDISAVKEVLLAGEWNATSILPDGTEVESVIVLKGTNSNLKGKVSGEGGDLEINEAIAKDGGLRFDFEFEMNGNILDIDIKSKTEGNNKLVGKWTATGDDGSQLAEGDWSALRKPKSMAGTWAVVATVPDNADYNGTLVLTQKDGKYRGTSGRNDSDKTALETITINDKGLQFSVPFERDGNTGTITVKAKKNDDGSLKGEWILTSESGEEWAREAWTATRQ